jgi:hypothetical protein
MLIAKNSELSKAIEIIMKRQIIAFTMDRGLLSDYQSDFRTHHTNDLLIATDERLVSLLVLLNFSKAFNSDNHHLLCCELSSQFGLTTSAVYIR